MLCHLVARITNALQHYLTKCEWCFRLAGSRIMPDRDRVAFIIFILFYFIMNGQKKVEMQSQHLLLKETRECTCHVQV